MARSPFTRTLKTARNQPIDVPGDFPGDLCDAAVRYVESQIPYAAIPEGRRLLDAGFDIRYRSGRYRVVALDAA